MMARRKELQPGHYVAVPLGPDEIVGVALELPVEELLLRARPRPPHVDMLIDDLDEDDGMEFLAALRSVSLHHAAPGSS